MMRGKNGPSRWIVTLAAALGLGGCSAGLAADGPAGVARPLRARPNPKVRAWQEYPFFPRPPWSLHERLWEDFADRPAWTHRGNVRYAMPHWYWPDDGKNYEAMRETGFNVVHLGQTGARDDRHRRVKRAGLPVVARLDGRFFWGRDYMDLFGTYWHGMASWHNYPPNVQWYRKFPPSLWATRRRRDGELIIEYAGSLSQRRDLSVVHPVSIQMRDAFLRECLLAEQVFDLPLDRPAFGEPNGVWWDNATSTVPSYDAYSAALVAREFAKAFEKRYRQRFDKEFDAWLATRKDNRRFQREHPTPESVAALRERRWQTQWAQWFHDPLYFVTRHHDRQALRWWNRFWADALAGYYAWQYRTLQTEIAPKRGLTHMFAGGNFLVDPATLYLFSWPTLDVMGPSESGSGKHAAGYKLALAASNGKPGAVLRGGRRHPEWTARAEALACLGATPNLPQPYRRFQVLNQALYHNARPGARVGLVYHLTDGLHHNEIENIYYLCDQIWAAGAPLEIVTERHLSAKVLAGFDLLIVPGWRLGQRDVAGIAKFLHGGGNVLLIGDNRAADGTRLATALAGEPVEDGAAGRVGEGTLLSFSAQVLAQKQLAEALDALGGPAGCRVLTPDPMLLVNLLRGRDGAPDSIHLVNYAGRAMRNVRVRLPGWARGKALAFVSPHGGARALTAADDVVTVESLSVYGVIAACDDAASRDRLVERNRDPAFVPPSNATWDVADRRTRNKRIAPTDEGTWEFVVTTSSRWRGIAPFVQVRPEDLQPGQKLARLRASSQLATRRLDADVVTDGTGKVGRPHELALTIYNLGVPWSPEKRIFADRFAFVLVDERTGRRERVGIHMPPLTLRERQEAEAVRERLKGLPSKGHYPEVRRRAEVELELPTLPAATTVRRRSKAAWTPTQPGRYQVYLSYRYVDSILQGRPDLRTEPLVGRGGATWDDFFAGRPYLKPVYEERLPGLVIDVQK